MIKVVFFDWGHTLVTGFGEIEKKREKILEPYGLKWDKISNLWRNFYLLRSLGRLKTDQEMFNQLGKILALPDGSLFKKIRDLVIESHVITPETIDIVKQIKKRYKVGIISNNVREWVLKVLNNYRIKDLFDAIIISSTVGARKPDARIFASALKSVGVKPKEALFISDELAEDLVGAKGLGMMTVWLKSEKQKNEEKIFKPDATISKLEELMIYLKIHKNAKSKM